MITISLNSLIQLIRVKIDPGDNIIIENSSLDDENIVIKVLTRKFCGHGVYNTLSMWFTPLHPDWEDYFIEVYMEMMGIINGKKDPEVTEEEEEFRKLREEAGINPKEKLFNIDDLSEEDVNSIRNQMDENLKEFDLLSEEEYKREKGLIDSWPDGTSSRDDSRMVSRTSLM